MDARTVIADLRRRGIRLRVEGDRLIATPASALSSTDADWIRANKPAVLDALNGELSQPRRGPLRPHCLTCGAALPPKAMVRCPDCVDAAYRDRARRWETEGRAPPDDQPATA